MKTTTIAKLAITSQATDPVSKLLYSADVDGALNSANLLSLKKNMVKAITGKKATKNPALKIAEIQAFYVKVARSMAYHKVLIMGHTPKISDWKTDSDYRSKKNTIDYRLGGQLKELGYKVIWGTLSCPQVRKAIEAGTEAELETKITVVPYVKPVSKKDKPNTVGVKAGKGASMVQIPPSVEALTDAMLDGAKAEKNKAISTVLNRASLHQVVKTLIKVHGAELVLAMVQKQTTTKQVEAVEKITVAK
jgi:hypothetical protein